jgi:dipeptidyl aminopeptidase/acylaminoacyl peptidase
LKRRISITITLSFGDTKSLLLKVYLVCNEVKILSSLIQRHFMKRLIFIVLLSLPLLLTAQELEFTPNENLYVDGLPPVPMPVVEEVGRYSEFRAASFQGWHPARREMLISTRFGDVSQIHQVKFPLGARAQQTFFPESPKAPLYEPINGAYFIFAMDKSGDEFDQLYRFDVTTHESVRLTQGDKSQNRNMVFSNKGDRLVYSSTQRNGKDRDIFILNPLDKSSNKLLVQNEGGGWSVSDWSPDDAKIIMTQSISINESYLWLIDVRSGKKELLTPKTEEKIARTSAVFSADGKNIYLITDEGSEFKRLMVLDLSTKALTPLTTIASWDVEELALSKDRTKIAFVTNEDGIGVLHVRDLIMKQELKLPTLPIGIVGGVEWHSNGKEIGFTFTSSRFPSDAYSITLDAGRLERWTESETGGIKTETFAEPELVKWKSFDGKMISGFLYRPAAKFSGKRPVMVNIHGGPEGQSRPSFMGRLNYYLNELGVAILLPNVRGSEGYGKTFLQLDNGFNRDHSYKDIATLCDWIKEQPLLDGNRILVTGGSYGGIATLAVATFYSDKIRCALSVVGASNLVTFLENTADYRRDLRRVEYGDERDPKMREYLNSIAPMNHAEKIKKPLFIVQGLNDPRVPASEADQMVKKLKSIQTPVWYLLGKNEGHGFAKKKNIDFQFYSTVQFVKRYLLDNQLN